MESSLQLENRQRCVSFPAALSFSILSAAYLNANKQCLQTALQCYASIHSLVGFNHQQLKQGGVKELKKHIDGESLQRGVAGTQYSKGRLVMLEACHDWV